MSRKIMRHTVRICFVLALLTALVGAPGAGSGAALAAPNAAALPATTGTLAGTTRTFELWATAGTLSLPGGVTVPVWGYSDTMGGPAQVPGPMLIGNEGETFEVILHNDLAESTGLLFMGQGLPADVVGVAAGGAKTYTFAAAASGTFTYEAGPLPNAQHQVAMGMYGAVIVRPALAPSQAYSDPATAFVDEALVVISELDPALNNSADPAAFDMRDWKPAYNLINGKAYPDTDPVLTAPGSSLLLRYVNAGLLNHSMSVLSLHQTVIGLDGNPLRYSYQVTAETLGAGQTADMLLQMPAAPPAGTARYALCDGNLMLFNPGAIGGAASVPFGGMLTFITIPDGAPAVVGPTTSAVALSPNPTNGTVDVTLTATVSGSATIAGAEYFIDAAGAAGTGTPMAAADGAFNSATENVTATILAADLALLMSGNHTIYVHGQDATPTWGAFNFAVLNLDKAGPMTSRIVLTPGASNGSVDVLVRATGDDSANGGSNITAAEYFIDAIGANGTGTPLTVNVTAPVASLEGTIPAATIAALAEGSHTLSIHSQDALGNWGMYGSVSLLVDKTGPSASAVRIMPNPNNGKTGISSGSPYLRAYATLTDAAVAGANSNVVKAEGFIDTLGAEGTGFPFMAIDGLFDSPSETAYANVPLATVLLLAEGNHTVYVRGKDAAGNWGTAGTTTLVIDKMGPTISAVAVAPNPANGVSSVTLTATATDAASNVVAAEWFEGADPGQGQGMAMQAVDGAFDSLNENLTASVSVVRWATGNHTLYVRAKDAAGNWSATGSVVLNVIPPDAIFADGFESGTFAAWTSTFGAGISVTPAAAMKGTTRGMQAVIAGNTPGYVADGTPNLEPTYHARFYFNPNGTQTGNAQQLHDIFAGFDAASTEIFRIQYRRLNAGGGTYQVRGGVLTNAGWVSTNWFTISNAAHALEIAWASGASAQFVLYIDGAAVHTLNNLNTSAYLLDSVLLGPSTGLVAQASGTEYFDEFVSRRYTVIGP